MASLSDSEIRGIIAGWIWQAGDSPVFSNDRYHLSLRKHEPERNIVERFSHSDPNELADEIEDIVRSNGRNCVTWQVKPGCIPEDMGEMLLRRGYTAQEPLDYLYFDMGEGSTPSLPDLKCATDATVERVKGIEDAVESLRIRAAAFNYPEGDERELLVRGMAVLEEAERYGTLTMIARLEGEGVSTGKAVADGPVVKLFGGCTHPNYRSSGFYGALTLERCMIGFDLGARYAVVTARASTSSPILQRAGFRRVGSEQHYDRQLE